MKNVRLELPFSHQYDVDLETELPPAGEMAQLYYPLDEHTRMRDGLVIKVIPYEGSPWIGIFASGYPKALTGIFSYPHKQKICVVSSGQACIIRVDNPHIWEKVQAFPIRDVRVIPEKQMLVLADFTALVAYGPEGILWKTDRLSWDGLKILDVGDACIRGLGWDSPLGKDVEFVVDLKTGQHKGGPSFAGTQ